MAREVAKTVKIVYIGRRLMSTGKMALCFMEVETGDTINWKGFKSYHLPIGTISEIDQSPSGGWYTGDIRPIGFHDDPEQVAAWELEARVDYNKEQIEKRIKPNSDVLDKRIEALLKVVNQMSPLDRGPARAYIVSRFMR